MEAATAGLWGSEQTARTIAHELGHYLTLEHRNDEPDNLMCQSGSASSTRNSTVLTNDQGSDMRDHCMTHGGCDVMEVQPGRYSVEELRTMIFEKRGPLAPVLALATLRRTDYPEAEKLADLRRAAENTGLDIRTRRAACSSSGASARRERPVSWKSWVPSPPPPASRGPEPESAPARRWRDRDRHPPAELNRRHQGGAYPIHVAAVCVILRCRCAGRSRSSSPGPHRHC